MKPENQTNTYHLRCSPDNIEDFEGCPETAVVTLTPELFDRVVTLSTEVERLKVYSIVAATACVTFHAWAEDEDGTEILGEEVPTDTHLIHVTRDELWFTGCMEVSGRRFSTEKVAYTLAELQKGGEPVEVSEKVARNRSIWRQYLATTDER